MDVARGRRGTIEDVRLALHFYTISVSSHLWKVARADGAKGEAQADSAAPGLQVTTTIGPCVSPT